ncbi:MAG: YeeE/YedE family protein [Methylomicrobium sp.]|nr:YeeE/YedE family protein [Methylomicrobium sp.]
MKNSAVALICGIMFGAGLTLSQMTDPAKVLSFLDIAGNWDPSLIFVMLGALTVTMISFRRILKKPSPLWAQRFVIANRTALDKPLILGSAIFGIGWGITGYCPGPSVAGLGLGNTEALIMVCAIYAGFWAQGKMKV